MINPRLLTVDSGKSEMVEIKDQDETKDADVEDQIRKLISLAATQFNNKNDAYDTEDQYSEEEASTSSDGESDASGKPDYYSDHLFRFCDDDDTPLDTVQEKSDEYIHDGFQCDVCNGVIIGFRYTCLQCSHFDLCIACESSGAHDEHYILRVPRPRHCKRVEAIVARIRSYLEVEIDVLTPVVINDICDNSLSENNEDLSSNDHEEAHINPVDTIITMPEHDAEADKLDTVSESTVCNELKDTDKPSNETHIKKPLNAFMIFLNEKRPKMKDENISKEMHVLNKIMGRQWRNLSEEERSVYYKKAREERLLHKLKYPDWKASHKPKKKRNARPKDTDTFKKCRGTFGLKFRDLWCVGCRRKKKCLRPNCDSISIFMSPNSPHTWPLHFNKKRDL